VHDIGHFRYLECARLDAQNQPLGELNNWDEIRVPFDPHLRDEAETLTGRPVRHFQAPPDLFIEEEYSCDSNGNLKVRICDKSAEDVTEYNLGHWKKTKARR